MEFEDHATQWLLRDELRFLSSKENLNPLRSWDPRSTAEFKVRSNFLLDIAKTQGYLQIVILQDRRSCHRTIFPEVE